METHYVLLELIHVLIAVETKPGLLVALATPKHLAPAVEQTILNGASCGFQDILIMIKGNRFFFIE